MKFSDQGRDRKDKAVVVRWLFLVQGHGRTTHLLVRGNSWEEAAHVLGQL